MFIATRTLSSPLGCLCRFRSGGYGANIPLAMFYDDDLPALFQGLVGRHFKRVGDDKYDQVLPYRMSSGPAWPGRSSYALI